MQIHPRRSDRPYGAWARHPVDQNIEIRAGSIIGQRQQRLPLFDLLPLLDEEVLHHPAIGMLHRLPLPST